MSAKVKASARVVVTLEFSLKGHWSVDCDVATIQRQAAEEARTAVMAGLALDGQSVTSYEKTNAQFVCAPKVTVILVEAAS